MAVTAKDVAQRLGVSPAAVSLALRGRPGVSEGTRERILETARQMGYPMEGRTPDKSGMLQMVIYKRHGKVFSDTPFFEQLTEGVAEQARTRRSSCAASAASTARASSCWPRRCAAWICSCFSG